MVITGVSGGEFGTRGSVTAYDATTGKQKWRFYTIPGPGRDRPRHVAAEQRRLEGRRRARLADAVGGSGARDAVLHDRQRRTRQQRQHPRRQEPVHRVDGRARSADREAQVVVPDGAPRHLGLRRAEPDDPLRRHRQRQGREGDRRGREDRLGLSAESRNRKAAVPDAGEEGAAGASTRRRGRRSRSRRTSRSSRTRSPTRSTAPC